MSMLAQWGVRDHSGVVRRFDDSKSPQGEFFWELFRKAGTYRPIPGDHASWDEVSKKRHLAPITGPDASHKNVELMVRGVRGSTMACIKLKKRIPGSRLFRERAPGSDVANAELVIADEIAELWKMVRKTRNWMCAQTLLGSLAVTAANVPGTDYPFTINYATNAQSAATDWSGGAPTILADLDTLMGSFIGSCDLEPRVAVTNDAVQSYLRNDANIQELLSFKRGDDALQDSPVSPAVFQRAQIAGLEWLVSYSGFTPVGGNRTRFLATPAGDADRVILLPGRDELSDVLRLYEGTLTKPSGSGPYGASESDYGGIEQTKPGSYGFSKIDEEGTGLNVYVGWVGLPVLTFPEAVTVVNVSA